MADQITPAERNALRDRIVELLKGIYDPEIPISIYDLGLIYEVNVDDTAGAEVIMTLTTPNCFAAQIIPGQVETGVAGLEGVRSSSVKVVWDPPWSKDLMSEAAQLELGLL